MEYNVCVFIFFFFSFFRVGQMLGGRGIEILEQEAKRLAKRLNAITTIRLL